MSENKKQSIFEKIKNNKNLQKISLVILIVIFLAVFLFSTFSVDKSEENLTQNVDAYVTNLEKRLTETLSQVEGAGKVKVVLTVESGMETVLAMKTTKTETANGVEIIETPILVNGKTVVLKENYPKVVGVLIVAEGAKNISVLSKLQQATKSLLDVNVNQIEILTMK